MATIRSNCILTLSNVTATSSDSLPRVPNIDDIEDLTNQIQETTGVLSCLLMRERKWMQQLSLGNLQLLEVILDQFQEFCDAAGKLLQYFSDFSQLFATLFGSVQFQGLQTYNNLEHVAEALCVKATQMSDLILSVENHPLQPFTCNFRKLLDIAPEAYISSVKYLTDLQNTFRRLDAFWKVVATYLLSLRECSLEPALPHESMDAESRWSDYILRLDDTKRILNKVSDSLQAVTPPKRAPGSKRLPGRLRNLFRS